MQVPVASTTAKGGEWAASPFEIDRRRNFAIISHPDAGKTTLTEKLLLYGGAIQEVRVGAQCFEAKNMTTVTLQEVRVVCPLVPFCGLERARFFAAFFLFKFSTLSHSLSLPRIRRSKQGRWTFSFNSSILACSLLKM